MTVWDFVAGNPCTSLIALFLVLVFTESMWVAWCNAYKSRRKDDEI